VILPAEYPVLFMHRPHPRKEGSASYLHAAYVTFRKLGQIAANYFLTFKANWRPTTVIMCAETQKKMTMFGNAPENLLGPYK
jgi:hypothetical protein